MNTKYLLPLFALSSYAHVAFSEEFVSQQIVVDGSSVDYVSFSLAQDSVIDVAASSALTDVELFLIQGKTKTGTVLANNDDSCLSVDCGLVGNYQFNPLIDNQPLAAGDYQIAVGAADLTAAEVRQGNNLSTSDNNALTSNVLLKIGDQNLIQAGTGLGSASTELKLNSIFSSMLGNAKVTAPNTVIDTDDNVRNTAQAIYDICTEETGVNKKSSCEGFSDATPAEMTKVMDALMPEEISAVASSSVATSKSSSAGVTARLSGLKAGYIGGINISGVTLSGGAAGDDDTIGSQFGLFINGEGGFGNKQRTRNEVGYNFESGGLTVGVDTALNAHTVLGIAFNYNRTNNHFIGQTGQLETDSYTGSVYGSYYLSDFYIDTTVSVGSSHLALSRQIAYNTRGTQLNETALGNTNAMQYLGSINIGYQYNYNALLITPSIGVNYANTQVDAYNETGSRKWSIAYQNQSIESLRTTLGTQIAYTFSAPWGVLTPQLQGEWLHEFSYDAQSNQVSFVNNRHKTFVVRSDRPDRDYFNIGLNVAAQFKNGLSGFFAYNSLLGRDYVTYHGFSVGMRLEL